MFELPSELSGLQRWLAASPARRILGAAMTVGALTIVAKVVGLAKELVVAARFGAHDSLDAFLVALVVPSFVAAIVGSAVRSSFTPAYVEARALRDDAAATDLLAEVTTWTLGVVIALTVALVAAAPLVVPLVSAGFGAAKSQLVLRLLCQLTPLIVLVGLGTIWGSVLNAQEKFWVPAVSPVALPLVTVMCIVFMAPGANVEALTVGTVAGAATECAVLGWAVHRSGVKLRLAWHGWSANVSRVAHQFLPMIAGALMMGLNPVVDRAMAAWMPAGSVSVLNYGLRLVAMPVTLAGLALGTAVMPHFSQLVARGEWDGVRHILRRFLPLSLAGGALVALGFIVFSEPIVRIIYERGAFTAENTRLVARIQALYALQIPFYAAGIIVGTLASAARQGRIMMIVASVNLVNNVILNFVFLRWLGVAGIALSTSVVYAVSFCLVFVMLRSRTEVGWRRGPEAAPGGGAVNSRPGR